MSYFKIQICLSKSFYFSNWALRIFAQHVCDPWLWTVISIFQYCIAFCETVLLLEWIFVGSELKPRVNRWKSKIFRKIKNKTMLHPHRPFKLLWCCAKLIKTWQHHSVFKFHASNGYSSILFNSVRLKV